MIEVGGPGTLEQSFKCIKFEGVISVIGFLGGASSKGQPSILDTLSNICTVRGVYVGSKALMRDMIRAIEANDIHPVVDETVFTLDQTRDAYDYMVRGRLSSLLVRSLTDSVNSGLRSTSASWPSRSVTKTVLEIG